MVLGMRVCTKRFIVCTDFHVPNDRVVVQDFVRACSVCQRNKSEHLQPGGLLQPLEVPSTVWSDVAMDFVEALPKVNGKSVILTVINRFSKELISLHFLTRTQQCQSQGSSFLRWFGCMDFQLQL